MKALDKVDRQLLKLIADLTEGRELLLEEMDYRRKLIAKLQEEIATYGNAVEVIAQKLIHLEIAKSHALATSEITSET